MDQDQSQPQRIAVQLDMDDARRQLQELADEFKTLLAQSIRMATKDATQVQTPAPQGQGVLAGFDPASAAAGVTVQITLTEVSRKLDDLIRNTSAIQSAVSRTNGTVVPE